MNGEVLYRKVGRRYEVAAVHWSDLTGDVMRPGQWRLTYCYTEGGRRYEYDVKPDTASFVAACQLARAAMEKAISDKAVARAQEGVISPYTKRQRALIEKFRIDMAEAGGLVPTYWQHGSAHEISQAAIDAVRKFGEQP